MAKKKTNFGPNFGLFRPNLTPFPPSKKKKKKKKSWVLPVPAVRNCSKLASYAISMKTNKPNFRK